MPLVMDVFDHKHIDTFGLMMELDGKLRDH